MDAARLRSVNRLLPAQTWLVVSSYLLFCLFFALKTLGICSDKHCLSQKNTKKEDGTLSNLPNAKTKGSPPTWHARATRSLPLPT